MPWKIEYSCKDIGQFVLKLPLCLSARYLHLTDLMITFGSHLGMPHTKPMPGGLFELRIKSKEGIGRVFYYTLIGKRIVMLHGFVKKTQKTPSKELQKAKLRFLEVLKNDS